MKLKKVFAGLVLFAATLSLVACGSKSEKTEGASSEATTEKAAETMMLKDGTYTGESAYDERGWKVVDSITVKDGKITESKFDYENKDGKKKSEDEEYNTSMKAKSGISSKDATDQLNAALVEKQDVSMVEVVSGATHSSNDFMAATKALLAAAEKGSTDPVTFDLGK